MLTRVKIQNFKSIGEPGVDLELKPLTILVGPNGGGKSSILEAIALISQSVRRELQINGDLVQFASPKDIAHKGELQRTQVISIGLSNPPFTYTFEAKYDTGELGQTITYPDGSFVQMRLVGDRREGYNIRFADESSQSKLPFGNTFPLFESAFIRDKLKTDTQWQTSHDLEALRAIITQIGTNIQAGERLFLLSSLRGFVPPTAGTELTPRWVGTKGENLIGILEFLDNPTYPAYEEVRRKTEEWNAKFGLGDVTVGISGPNKMSGYFRDPMLRTPLNLYLASHGARQILSVITQLFWSGQGSIVLIEEPEESLHPGQQVNLIDLFGDAVKEGKQVIVTSHSSLLALAIGESVSANTIRPEDVGVYEVTKTSEGTKAQGIPITEKGYLKGWVPSFAKVEAKLLRNTLNRLPKA